MTTSEHWNIDWRFPLLSGIVTLAIFIPCLLSPAFDLAEIFFLFIGVPATLLVLLIFAVVKRSLSVLTMAITVALLSYFVGHHANEIRFNGRWLLWRHEYKAKIMSNPEMVSGLPHAEWDGWGFAGDDTVVYAVFDANDTLGYAAKKRLSGKMLGIPCEVWRVYKLEKHWYSVVMYTDTGWNDCKPINH